MDNLSYISMICLVVSLGLMIPLMERRTRSVVLFTIIGIFSCLFVSELNNILLQKLNQDMYYVTTAITPVTEELVKAIPILYYALVISDDRKHLIANAYAVGVGFAMLENIVILVQNIESVSIPWALVRGFGSGLVHGLCTVMVGYGISFVRKRRKLFLCGTFALLSTAIIYHASYNVLVQSSLKYAGIFLPVATYLPMILLMKLSRRADSKAAPVPAATAIDDICSRCSKLDAEQQQTVLQYIEGLTQADGGQPSADQTKTV